MSALLILKYNGLVHADIFRMPGICVDNLKRKLIYLMNVYISNLRHNKAHISNTISVKLTNSQQLLINYYTIK